MSETTILVIITALIAVIPGTITSIATLRNIGKIHELVNSNFSEMREEALLARKQRDEANKRNIDLQEILKQLTVTIKVNGKTQ